MNKLMTIIISLASIMLAASCSKDYDEIPGGLLTDHTTREDVVQQWKLADAGTVAPGSVDWHVEDSTINLLSTMSLTFGVPEGLDEENVTEEDKIAVFCEDQCLGVTSAFNTNYGMRFMMNIYKPYNNVMLTVAYYSKQTNRTYFWHRTIHFSEDAIIGHVDNPYSLNIEDAREYRFIHAVAYMPAKPIEGMSNDDVVAFFVGNQCRGVVGAESVFLENAGIATDYVNLHNIDEQVYIRHFCSKTGRIYRSDPFTINPTKIINLIRTEMSEEK